MRSRHPLRNKIDTLAYLLLQDPVHSNPYHQADADIVYHRVYHNDPDGLGPVLSTQL